MAQVITVNLTQDQDFRFAIDFAEGMSAPCRDGIRRYVGGDAGYRRVDESGDTLTAGKPSTTMVLLFLGSMPPCPP
jgi:hypothetical protein